MAVRRTKNFTPLEAAILDLLPPDGTPVLNRVMRVMLARRLEQKIDDDQFFSARDTLLAAGKIGRPAVRSGIDYLLQHQGEDGFWDEPRYTATGFPRVFYLRYHGYSKFFPLWALARYRNLKRANARAVAFGM